MTVYLTLLKCDTNNTEPLCLCQLDLLYYIDIYIYIECKCVDSYAQTSLLVLGISPAVCTHQRVGCCYSPK